MKIYSIRLIAKPKNRAEKTWALSQCSNIDKVKERLRRIRQLVNVIPGSSSELLTELTDWVNIAQSCDPTWRRTIVIPEYRMYTLSISLPDRRAIITAKDQGEIVKIGLARAIDMADYQDMISFMNILIQVLEENNSPNEQWVKDMAVGKTHPYQNDSNIIALQQKVNLYAKWKKCQYLSLTGSHPPEINIYTPPSSYEIIITRA